MSENSKKYYISPEINSIKLDKGIVLLEPTGNPTSVAPVDPERPAFSPSSTPPSEQSTPFGGDRPDYGDM